MLSAPKRQNRVGQHPVRCSRRCPEQLHTEEGDYFKAEWLRPYDKAPPRETLRIYGASDMRRDRERGDFTVHIVVGVDPEWRIYVLDLWRAQSSSADWVERSVIW